MKPMLHPERPFFSSGPCAKPPGWKPSVLQDALLGRSHRSDTGAVKIRQVLQLTREVLQLPDDYRLGIVPASDTGAVELALWSMLGARGVDIFAWESFGLTWVKDVVKELKLADVRQFVADYGELPELTQADWERDVVFVWNGTTSGVRVPNGDWIAADRQGLSICDATSALFAMELPWDKLDVTTFSWQKALGGEAAHGMIVLSPRAVERLESYQPPWPLPKLFRLTKAGRLDDDIFTGGTINTPSMLCVEDFLQALQWAKRIGGLPVLLQRCQDNYRTLADWVEQTPWIDFLARDPAARSPTSVCLSVVDSRLTQQPPEQQRAWIKRFCRVLEAEQAAFDIGAYRDAPPGLRIWCGATVAKADIAALLPWLEWALQELRANP